MFSKIYKETFKKIRRLKFVDFLIIGLSLTAIIIFAVFFFRKSVYVNATISVGEDSVYYEPWVTSWTDISGNKSWFANVFYKGQSEKDGLGRQVAQVLSVYKYQKTPTRQEVLLNVRLMVVYNRASNTYTYKGVPVLIGSKLKLDLDNVYAEGTVTAVNGFPNYGDMKKMVVETEIRDESNLFLGSIGTKPYVADVIKVGDQVTNNNGDVVVKIIDKKVTPALKTVTTSDGRVIQVPDPVVKDVVLNLEVEAIKIGDSYYLFYDSPIMIDQPIPINTSTYSIFPVVTKIISVE